MAQTKVRLPDWFIPTRYSLTLEPDLKRHAFSGSVDIEYVLKKPTQKITLHALELSLVEARIGTYVGTPSYDTQSETVTLTFPQTIKKGRGVLTVSYTGTLNDKMRGFYRSHYQVGGKDETMAVTQFESTFARFALPCVDEPKAKAVFDVTLIVEPGLTTISNTIETKTEKLDDGRVKVMYAPTPKMSTYLLAFIVGRFGHLEKKTKRGTLTRVFAPKGKESHAQFALDVAVKCLDFYEDYFKIRYPLPVVDHIAIPDFSAGAMENWGAITYRETALLFDPKESSAQNKQRIALVIAHELAHQWFGNLVTMEWWTDLWLNEGFANYIEYLAINHIFPEWDIWTQFVDTEANEAMRLDALASTHPIEIEVHHPSEINEIFDSVSYAKGATVLRMLAAYIGPRAFQKGLHIYLRKHAYGNARTRDLWAALEKASGKPVRKVMEGWTKKGGYPVVSVTRSSSQVVLKQERYFSSPGTTSKDRWAIPMTIHAKKKVAHLFTTSHARIDIPQAAPWVNANVGAVGMYRTKYDTASLMALGSAVASGSLTAAEKVRVVNDLFALAFSNQGSSTDALSFISTLKDETDYSVWSAVCVELLKLRVLIEGSEFQKTFDRFVATLLLPTRDRLDWSPKPKEPHTDALLRGLIFHTLVAVDHEETLETCRAHFKAHEQGSRLAPDLRPAVYAAFAKTSGNPVPVLTKHYEHEEMHAEKNRYLVALGAVGPKHLGPALTYALGNTVRFQDTRWTFLSGARSVKGAEVVFETLKKNWDLIVERYGTSGHDLPRYVHCMDVFSTEEKYREVASFFKAHKSSGAKRAVKQLLETIKARVLWRKKNLSVVEAWLSDSESSLLR